MTAKTIKKELIVNGVKGILEYDLSLIGKEANDFNSPNLYAGAQILLENKNKYTLHVNGEDVYDEDTQTDKPDYYFEVDGNVYLSDAIYGKIENEKDLINTLLADATWDYAN